MLSFCHYCLCDDKLADFLDYFESKEIGVINASPLSMGLLSERGVPAWHPAPKPLVEACRKRDAKAELDKAGKSRVDLLARVKLSHDKLKDLRERKASLEARALEALSKNVNPSLINEVAEEIARLENLITAEEQVLSNLEVSRDGVEKAVTATAQRIAQFEQQMEVVKATEAMQRAQQAVTTSTVGASSSVSTAAESLKRLQTRQAERQARLDAAAQLEKVADGRDLQQLTPPVTSVENAKSDKRVLHSYHSPNGTHCIASRDS